MSMHDGPGTDRESDGGLSDMGGGNDTSSEDHGRGNDYGGSFSGNVSGQSDYGESQTYDGLGGWDNDTTSETQGRFNDYDGAFSSSTLGRGIDRISFVDGVLYETTTVGIIADNILEDAIEKFGIDQINYGVITFGLTIDKLQDYGTSTLKEKFGILTSLLSGNVFGAYHRITKNFSNNLHDVHVSSEIDKCGSIGSKIGAAAGMVLGLPGIIASNFGYQFGSMYAEYSIAKDMKAAGLEPLGPRNEDETDLSSMLDSISDGGNQDDIDTKAVSAGSASDQEVGFTLSPSYASEAEKVLANMYLLPIFNNSALMSSKAVMANFASADSFKIEGFDYDGLFGADVFSTLIDAGGMFLFVKSLENKGNIF